MSKPASLDGGLASFDNPKSKPDSSDSSSAAEVALPQSGSGSHKLHHVPSHEERLKRPVSPASNLLGNKSLTQAATPRDSSPRHDDHDSPAAHPSRSEWAYKQESLYNSAVWGSHHDLVKDTQIVVEHLPMPAMRAAVGKVNGIALSPYPKHPDPDASVAREQSHTREGSNFFKEGTGSGNKPDQTQQNVTLRASSEQQAHHNGEMSISEKARQGGFQQSPNGNLNYNYGQLTSAGPGNQYHQLTSSNVAQESLMKRRNIPKNLELISLTSSGSSDLERSPIYHPLAQHQELPSSATKYAMNALDRSVEYSPTEARRFASNKTFAGKEPQHTPPKVPPKQDHSLDTKEPIQGDASAPSVQKGSVKAGIIAGLAMRPSPWHHSGWVRRPEHQRRYSDDSITFAPPPKQPFERPARLQLESDPINQPFSPRPTGRPARLTFECYDYLDPLRFHPISKNLIYDENLHPALRSHPYFNPMDRLNPCDPYKPADPDRKYPELCRDNVVVQNLMCEKIRAMTVTPEMIAKPPPKKGLKDVLKQVSQAGFPNRGRARSAN